MNELVAIHYLQKNVNCLFLLVSTNFYILYYIALSPGKLTTFFISLNKFEPIITIIILSI